jgi:hypothetical protein
MKCRIIVLLVCTSVYSKMIGDFAPISLNSEWKYSYESRHWWNDQNGNIKTVGGSPMTLTVTVSSISSNQNDTTIILKYVNCNDSDKTIPDTCYDTVLISRDSIHCNCLKDNGFSWESQKYPTPFWTVHEVDSSILKQRAETGSFGYFDYNTNNNNTSSSCNTTYLQNVGLYRYYKISSQYDEVLSLISFNNAPVAIGHNQNNQLKALSKKSGISKVLILDRQFKTGSNLYGIDGRKICQSNHVGKGIYFQKINNY